MVGCCWVPAGDAGMAGEEGEREEGRGVREDGNEEEEGGDKGRPYRKRFSAP